MIRLINLLLFLLFVSECVGQSDKKAVEKSKMTIDSLTHNDTIAVLEVINRRSEAMSRRDANLHRQNYAPDAQWLNAFGIMRKSRDSIVKFLAGLYADPGFQEVKSTRQDPPELTFIRSDVALVHQYMELEGQWINDVALPKRKIHTSFVLTKEEGKWLIRYQVIMDEKSPRQ